MDTAEAIRKRQSTRAFLDRDVSDEIVTSILDTARWAPSGVNTQPWQVAVLRGQTKQRVGDDIIAARERGDAENPDYQYYPTEWADPYKTRRFECGMALYGALGIGREDKDKRKQAWYANYHFFGAPVGLLFFLDRQLSQGSWVDMGMFIQSVMLSAINHGLATCPQASLAEYPDIVRNALDIPRELALVCGMALGYPDEDAPVNNYRTTREPVEKFTRWFD
jgi:nitroreductase